MKLLGVETSSGIFSVAISDGPQILSSLTNEGVGRPSTLLADLIRQAVSAANLSLQDLDGLAVSIGPGSFTGLRVGVMTVKTLAWALKKPVVPVSTLEVIAHNFSSQASPICLFMDARKGKVYTALFSSNGIGQVKRFSEDALGPPGELLKKLEGPAILVGDGLKRYPELVAAMGERKIRLAPESSWVPSAEAVCRIAIGGWPSGVVDDPHRLVPQYLYSKESDITGW